MEKLRIPSEHVLLTVYVEVCALHCDVPFHQPKLKINIDRK